MKPLYKEDDSYTNEASELAEKLRVALEPILKSYFDQGYDAAHIENLANGIVSHICTFATAKRAMDRRVRNSMPPRQPTSSEEA